MHTPNIHGLLKQANPPNVFPTKHNAPIIVTNQNCDKYLVIVQLKRFIMGLLV